jgi:hypothetical protein
MNLKVFFMKSKWSFFIVAIIFNVKVTAQQGVEILKTMHKKYYQAPCKNYSFSQRNTLYKNDSVIGNSVWHEAVQFPDKFRINFGNTEEGNYVIFKNDSVFNYRQGKLLKAKADSNSLLLLLGGMYYRDLDNVITRLKNAGFKLDVVTEREWNNELAYVIGAREHDLSSPQFWVSKKTLRVLRIIKRVERLDRMDMRFEAHQDWCKGYMETKVSFRRNGQLEQVEEYYDIKQTDKFPEN